LALRDWRSRKRDRMKHKPPPRVKLTFIQA
jgi:hypothetical protein